MHALVRKGRWVQRVLGVCDEEEERLNAVEESEELRWSETRGNATNLSLEEPSVFQLGGGGRKTLVGEQRLMELEWKGFGDNKDTIHGDRRRPKAIKKSVT